MNTYKNINYEIKPYGKDMQECVCTYHGYEVLKFWADTISDEYVMKQIDNKLLQEDVERFKFYNKDLFDRLANTYVTPKGHAGLWREIKADKFITKHYTSDHTELQRIIFNEVVRRENNKLSNIIDHMDEMSMIEFRRLIEKLTEHKVCVNGGKAYLHIYNWLYKNGKKTNYRTDNYYISVGQNLQRTEENAKMIAAKCLEFAKIENYGYKTKIPVEKF